MMFVEIPDVTFTMWQTWIGMSIRAQKTPEIVSRIWICTRSGEKSTNYIRLLFCTEKTILSDKLNKRYSLKRRSVTDLELREEVVVGS